MTTRRAVLRPQDNGVREAKVLDGLWAFAVDPAGTGREAGWWRGSLPDRRVIAVPSSYNDLFVDAAVRDHVGDVWYQRPVVVPRGWDGQRVVLRFDCATHRAVVWLDDDEVATHDGGYTPFEADITELARPGHEHRLTVVVDNVLSATTIPPGFTEHDGDGNPRQVYFHDFFNYAGLPRHVWLCATPRTHIADVTVSTEVLGDAGTVRYVVDLAGPQVDDLEVRTLLRDPTGAVVAEGHGSTAALHVADAVLWGPGAGNLYEVEVEVDVGGELVDRYRLPVGIRSVRVEGTRFLINGEPFHFRGFGMHEDHDVRGKGHDEASVIHDLALLRWTGANSFRTSHYPYAEEWLDHADRMGLVVIDETAAVGLNFHGHGEFPFGETGGAVLQAAHRSAIEELIARDKNHPSVVLWSIANEPESHTPASRTYFEPLFAAARAADPTRPVGFVNMILGSPESCRLSELGDVLMLNRYYGWYRETADLPAAERALEAELRSWEARYAKPIIVTEYGADALPGERSVLPTPWSEDYQIALLELYHRVFDRVDAVVGEHVWNFADFATAPSLRRAHGNRKGVFTRDRKPKAAVEALAHRWRAER